MDTEHCAEKNRAMPLSEADVQKLLSGLQETGLSLLGTPAKWRSPLLVRLRANGHDRRFRLWLFEVRHGGKSRDPGEYRIQVSNGPKSVLNEGGWADVLLGYSIDHDVLVAYDPRYLEKFLEHFLAVGESGSDSAQVSLETLEAAQASGVAYESKDTEVVGPDTRVAAFRPIYLSAFLFDREAFLSGNSSLAGASLTSDGTSFEAFASARGLSFPSQVVGRYVAALATKPLVILTGVSGTGKTKLAHLVAEYFCASPTAGTSGGVPVPSADGAAVYGGGVSVDRSRLAFVAVRPNWTDSRALLGFFNPLTERYEPTETLALLVRAHQSAEAARAVGKMPPPFFVILDEMNLARVEHYFSDFLSALETRKLGPGNEVEQEPLVLHDREVVSISVPKPGGGMESLAVPSRLPVPTNVFFTGTVNVDETTHGFSPKVLDRAHVIEFDDVDLDSYRSGLPATVSSGLSVTLPSELKPVLPARREDYAVLPDALHQQILALNRILQPARLHLGYRSVNEVAAFIIRYQAIVTGGTPIEAERAAMDAAVLQKVLPRLGGTRARLEEPLIRLFSFLVTGTSASGGSADLDGLTGAADASLA
ncbi:MAG TPA: hypothetical protein VF815_46985, partial [Myxococcaceae bacterium]